ncbi:MAG: TonB family protein [Proteobacteria bacterium]|nr:TonB family protein [Pseudomonadota bacterium]
MSTAAIPSFAAPEFARPPSPGVLAAIVAAHVLAIWGLLQLDGLRRTLAEQVPLMVSLVSAPTVTPTPQPVALAAPPQTPLPPQRAVVVPEITVVHPTAPPAPQPVALPAPAPAPVAASAPVALVAPAPVEPPTPTLVHLESNQIAFLREPQLVYPPLSVSRRESGTVVVRVRVDAQGQMQEVRVERSSGYERLDAAALSAMRTARFKPHVVRGRPTPFVALKPMVFDLG